MITFYAHNQSRGTLKLLPDGTVEIPYQLAEMVSYHPVVNGRHATPLDGDAYLQGMLHDYCGNYHGFTQPVTQFSPDEARDFHGRWTAGGFEGNAAYRHGSHRARSAYHARMASYHLMRKTESALRAKGLSRTDKRQAEDLKRLSKHHADLASRHGKLATKERDAARSKGEVFRVGRRGGTLATVSGQRDFGPVHAAAQDRHLEKIFQMPPDQVKEAMRENLRGFWRDASRVSADHYDVTHHPLTLHWYRDDAQAFGNRMAAMHGGSERDMYGVLAVLSPQREWGDNKAAAWSLAVHSQHLDEMRMTVSEDVARNYNSRYANEIARGEYTAFEPFSGEREFRYSDLSSHQIASMGQLPMLDMNGNVILITKKVDGVVQRVPASVNGVTGAKNTARALDILRGRTSIEEGVQGVKVRNFFNNIQNEADPRFVTMDTWMWRGLTWNTPMHIVANPPIQPQMSEKVKEMARSLRGTTQVVTGKTWVSNRVGNILGHFHDEVPKGAPITIERRGRTIELAHPVTPDRIGAYGVGADVVREVAAEVGLTPAQLQAVTWNEIRYQAGEELPGLTDWIAAGRPDYA